MLLFGYPAVNFFLISPIIINKVLFFLAEVVSFNYFINLCLTKNISIYHLMVGIVFLISIVKRNFFSNHYSL